MNIKQYLERIGYEGPVDITFEVLSQLQYMHLMHVPFENLDIHYNIKIDLLHLYDKIVTRKRGGFCYELNGLFYELLKEIGFTVKMVSARVYDGKKEFSPEFDHLALIVKINEYNYLVDAGFGEFSLQPILIAPGKETNDPRGIFKIETFDGNYMLVTKKDTEENFVPEYIFSEKERLLNEFQEMCNYHQSDPASHFMQKRICSLPTSNGRITLTGDILKITEQGVITERKLNTEQEVKKELWNHFGIQL
ncbi:arylamine N-acetyltransferase family protein [Ferruginibacter sp. SUN106]|uniref:arylamine N-acetyltransferase family protein n=1 Tax=Ferruginibacter sp. SUN106 TaxID=2978348 RepID=UPI003D35C719